MTWNIHQRNLTPHYYNAPEQQLNEGIKQGLVSTVASRLSKAGKTAKNFVKRHTRLKPLRDISDRTPERQQKRDQAASLARGVKKGIKKRERDPSVFSYGRREQETQDIKSKLDSAGKRHGGQIGRVLSKVKGRVHRSDHKMAQQDAAD